MAQAGKDASPAGGAVRYERHRPETTLLYQLVDEHYPTFADRMAAQGTPLPAYVQREFEDYLRCGRLEHGFLRVRCESCCAEHLVAFSWPLLRILCPRHLCIHAHHHAGASAPVAGRGAWPTTAWMQEVGRSRSQSRECGAAGR